MQLTKEDVETIYDLSKDSDEGKTVISLLKLQQIIEFYEKYRKHRESFERDNPEDYKHYPYKGVGDAYIDKYWNDWLFYYCFKDGLK